MKVYLITSGEYEDYHIDMICPTKELAEQNLALLKQRYEEFDNSCWDEETDLYKGEEEGVKWYNLFDYFNGKYPNFDPKYSSIEEYEMEEKVI